MSNYKVQSVLLDKNKYNEKDANKWIIKNGFKIKNRIDITQTYRRYRQYEPKYLEDKGYNKIRTQTLNNFIKLIIYYK